MRQRCVKDGQRWLLPKAWPPSSVGCSTKINGVDMYHERRLVMLSSTKQMWLPQGNPQQDTFKVNVNESCRLVRAFCIFYKSYEGLQHYSWLQLLALVFGQHILTIWNLLTMVCILLCMLIKLLLFAMTSSHPLLHTLFPLLTVNPLVSAKMHHFAYLQYWITILCLCACR